MIPFTVPIVSCLVAREMLHDVLIKLWTLQVSTEIQKRNPCPMSCRVEDSLLFSVSLIREELDTLRKRRLMSKMKRREGPTNGDSRHHVTPL